MRTPRYCALGALAGLPVWSTGLPCTLAERSELVPTRSGGSREGDLCTRGGAIIKFIIVRVVRVLGVALCNRLLEQACGGLVALVTVPSDPASSILLSIVRAHARKHGKRRQRRSSRRLRRKGQTQWLLTGGHRDALAPPARIGHGVGHSDSLGAPSSQHTTTATHASALAVARCPPVAARVASYTSSNNCCYC